MSDDQLAPALHPVGEYPDLPSGVPALLLAGNAVQAVAEIRARHQPEYDGFGDRFCPECRQGTVYPCPTMQILERLGLHHA